MKHAGEKVSRRNHKHKAKIIHTLNRLSHRCPLKLVTNITSLSKNIKTLKTNRSHRGHMKK